MQTVEAGLSFIFHNNDAVTVLIARLPAYDRQPTHHRAFDSPISFPVCFPST